MDKLFTIYWNQLLILLAVIGYFGKRAFDLSTKKVEVKYNLYYQNKIDSIKYFFQHYSKALYATLELNKSWQNLTSEDFVKAYNETVEVSEAFNKMIFFSTAEENERCGILISNLTKIQKDASRDFNENQIVLQETLKANNEIFLQNRKIHFEIINLYKLDFGIKL